MKNVILLIAVIGIAATAFLLTACSSTPPEANNAYYRGLDYARDKNYDKAIEELTLAIQLYPDFDIAYHNRGIVYALKGDYDKAVADCEAALRISPNYTAVKQLLAEAKQRQAQVAARSGSPSTPAQTAQAQATPAQPAPTPATPVQPVELGPPTVVQGNNLTEKMDWLKVFAQSNGNYIVEIRANENINNGQWELSFSGKSGITITLRGVGANRTITVSPSVGSGNTLILDNNITIQGGIHVREGGFLIMNNGSTITYGVSSEDGRVGTFTMNGGTISGSGGPYSKGGVSVGTFTMNGGTISGSGSGNGGVSVVGTFTMNGGTISGNEGRGVYVGNGTFTMRNGTISNNRSVGVEIPYGSTFTMSGGTISGNGNGGVYVTEGTFTMNGGTISGNTSNRGGGVTVRGIFTMNGGTISGNTAIGNRDYGYDYGSGGGVSVINGEYGLSVVTFTMNGGIISGNTANVNGGGVYVTGRGTFTMSNGTISGNTARESGGGVCVSQGTFTKTGGTIYGYSANDATNSNVVRNDSRAVVNYRGHAVYAGETSTLLKIREGTAGPGNNMAYDGSKKPPTASGAWDN